METLLVRALLRLHPRWLREMHGPEMKAFLLTRLERARRGEGRWSVAGIWWMALTDALKTAARGRRRPHRGKTKGQERKAGMGALVQDVRYAARRLVRAPLFTLGALAIIALAIGANTAAFTIVNHLLLTPPPFQDPDRVVNVYQDSDDGEPNSTSFPAYRDMAAMDDVFRSVTATSPDNATLETEDGGWPVAIEYTTASFMETAGLNPARGRWFDESMDRVGAGYYAVVSHHTWRERFGADPGIVGRVMRFNGQPVTVIGVGPEGFNGIGVFMVTDFWLSISSVAVSGSFRVANLDRRQDHWYDVKARLADGVSVAQAQEAVDVLAASLAEQFPDLNRGRDITVFPTREIRMHPQGDQELLPQAVLLMSVVVLILILASSNLAGLLLVRGVSRSQEVAIRRALGAARGRVARLFLGEAFLLSLAGGALGIALSQWLLGVMATLPIPLPFSGDLDLALDLRVLLFAVGLMMATGLFFGWAPALQSMGADLTASLREDGRSAGGRRVSLFRNIMVSVQMAVSVVLVLASGLMVRSLVSYTRVDPGVDTERVAVLRTDFSRLGLSPEERGVAITELTQRLSGLPGAEEVAVTSRIPLFGGASTTTVVEDYDPPSGTGSVELNFASVAPNYFRTMGMRLVEGRRFTPEDQRAERRVSVIVNEAAMARFWGGESPLGRRVRPQADPDGWMQVVGVVSDTKVRSLAENPTPMLYFALSEAGVSSPYFLVRTSGDPAALLPSLRGQLREVNSRLPVVQARTMASLVGESLAVPRMGAVALGAFSLLALLLASVGIYTIVAFTVAGRMPEIGIRMALGAQRNQVVSTVMREMALTVGLGLAAGTVLGLILLPRVQGFFYGAKVLSAGTLGPAALVLVLTVALAAYLPARRAAAADPVEALRAD
jgi:predicted permease